MIEYIKRKYSSLWKRVYFFSVDFGFPKLSAIALSVLITPINKTGKRHVLSFGSYASFHDIDAIIRFSGVHRYSHFPRLYIGYIVEKYLSRSELTEQNYYHNNEYIEGRKKVYVYLKKMFPVLKKLVSFDAMMTSNFGYVEQQELLKIGLEEKIPIIILYKEGLMNPKLIDNLMDRYKLRRAQCDLYICYSTYVKKALLRNEIKYLSEKKIKVSGIPRLDFYIKNKSDERGDTILLFSFYAHMKFIDVDIDENTLEKIDVESQNFHKFFVRYAKENPDKSVVIKTKPSFHHLEDMLQLAEEELGCSKMPCNLTITSDYSPMELIMGASCVFGSNSTTLLEALLVKKPIGSPDLRSYIDFSEWDLFDGYDYLVEYINSYKDLCGFIDSIYGKSSAKFDNKGLNRLLEQYVYSVDGNSSERVEKYIEDLF